MWGIVKPFPSLNVHDRQLREVLIAIFSVPLCKRTSHKGLQLQQSNSQCSTIVTVIELCDVVTCWQIAYMKMQGEFGKKHHKRRDDFSQYVEAAARAHHQLGSRPAALAASAAKK